MKKLYIILTFLTFSLFLSGCLNYEQITTLKIDGSGEMYIHYWFKVQNQHDSLVMAKVGIFSPDSIRKEYSSKHLNLENIEVYTDSTDSTMHAKIELTFAKFDSLNSASAFKDVNFTFKRVDKNTMVFSQFIPPLATGFGVNGQLFKISYVYYIPGEILSHNAMNRSNNKLTWDYNLTEIGPGKTISATFRPFKLKETPIWIYYAALLVISVVIFYLFKKKK